jgi:hypothetical protein
MIMLVDERYGVLRYEEGVRPCAQDLLVLRGYAVTQDRGGYKPFLVRV